MTKEETIKVINEVLAGKDEAPSSWAKEAWERYKRIGITDGTRPKGYTTREQVVTMIDRAL